MNATPLVTIESLVKAYRGASGRALDHIDLTIPRGSFFGLLGPNGAGKTTLISILCGILSADSGQIRIRAGTDGPLTPKDARAFIGLVPQELAFYSSLTVIENLAFFGAMQGLSGAALRQAMAGAIQIGRLEAVTRQRAETLSGGLKRRLNLAIAVLHAPPLLVLDEPTAGVDAQSRHYLLNELKRLNAQGTTIIYTSHYLDEVQQLCDRLAVIDRGQVIAQGALSDLLREDSVTLQLASQPPARFLEALAALAGVTAVHCDDRQIALITATPQVVLASALQLAAAQQIAIAQANMGIRNLQSLFFQLTGSRLRDDAQPLGADPVTGSSHA